MFYFLNFVLEIHRKLIVWCLIVTLVDMNFGEKVASNVIFNTQSTMLCFFFCLVFSKETVPAHDFSCTIWKDGIFFPENMIFFPWARSERRSFPGNTWKHDVSLSEEKQETLYIGSKLGFSLNLFGWRYSAMNNLQYLVPSSPHGPCLEVRLSADRRSYLSIRG